MEVQRQSTLSGEIHLSASLGNIFATWWLKSAWKCALKSPSLVCSRERGTQPRPPALLPCHGASESPQPCAAVRFQHHKCPELNDEHAPKMEMLGSVLPLRSYWFLLRHLIFFTEAKHLLSLAPFLWKSNFTVTQDFRYISSLRLLIAGSRSVLWNSSCSRIFEKQQGVLLPAPWGYGRRGMARRSSVFCHRHCLLWSRGLTLL